jgi:hypothetical protein
MGTPKRSMTLSQLVEKLEEIRNNGYIKTHRAHDTGVGKTLEDLLGIAENNLQVPDVGEVELKGQRIESGSMLTLVTKSPEPRGVNRRLFDRYRYKDEDGLYNLHSTVYGSRINPQGFKVTFKEDKLVLDNWDNIMASWPMSVFDKVLKSKAEKILLAFAETRGKPRTNSESFHYIEAYLLSDLDQERFKTAIAKGRLKVDIRIGVYRSGKRKGQYHDHGTAFRINKRDFLELFGTFKRLM